MHFERNVGAEPMTCDYENLGEERFQHLCQSIMTAAFPEIQCLPVGQPDGGRDAFIRRVLQRPQSTPVVFQIKFSKNPNSKDERDVITDVIKSEKAKVEKLRERGLEQYYLMTNVQGTSHLDVGSV